MFWCMDQRYAEKLKQLVQGGLAVGFHPHLEVFAKKNDAYLGIDTSARRLLAYPVNGAGYFFRFDEVNSCRIVPAGKRNQRLEVLTSNLDVSVFSIVLRSAEVLSIEARLSICLADRCSMGLGLPIVVHHSLEEVHEQTNQKWY